MTSWFSCFLCGSMGSQMFFAGSDDICGLNGDNGTIGVGDESSNGIGVSGSISIGSGNTVGGEVSLLSSNNLRGLGGGNSSVGIGYEGTMRVTVGTSVVSVVTGPGSGVGTVVVSVPSGISVGISSISTLGNKVSVFSGKDLRGLGGGNGTTGVGDELDSRGSSHPSEENQKLHV